MGAQREQRPRRDRVPPHVVTFDHQVGEPWRPFLRRLRREQDPERPWRAAAGRLPPPCYPWPIRGPGRAPRGARAAPGGLPAGDMSISDRYAGHGPARSATLMTWNELACPANEVVGASIRVVAGGGRISSTEHFAGTRRAPSGCGREPLQHVASGETPPDDGGRGPRVSSRESGEDRRPGAGGPAGGAAEPPSRYSEVRGSPRPRPS